MTGMDGAHRCNSTLARRGVWVVNKHILVERSRAASSNEPVLVANHISNCIWGILETLPEALTGKRQESTECVKYQQARPLTSLPMQRCCPTPFSHLWWRLILQALQRRPCFAVFPARNTTCLAVVPDTTTNIAGRGSAASRQQLASLRSEHSRLRTKWQRPWKKHGSGLDFSGTIRGGHVWAACGASRGATWH